MTQQVMNVFPHLSSPGTKNKDVSDVLKWIQNDELQRPPHQRERIWEDKKRDDFIKAQLLNNHSSTIPGAILTYQLINASSSIRYLNDGSQRMWAIEHFYENPDDFSISHEEVVRILDTIEIPVQHFIYDNHHEAYETFVHVNRGTLCTTYEAGHGTIVYMKNYDAFWKDIFDELHQLIHTQSVIVTGKNYFQREREHRYKRHSYWLFLLFINKTKEIPTIPIPPMAYAKATETSLNAIERKLVNSLKNKNKKWADSEFDKFKSFIINSTTSISDLWKDAKKEMYVKDEDGKEEPIDERTTITITLYRWLLTALLYRKHNNIPMTDCFDNFITRIYLETYGSTKVSDPKSKRSYTNLGIGKFSDFSRLCKQFNFDFDEYKRKHRNRSQVADGDHISHIKPVSRDGENDEVIIESASKNLARGNKPIDMFEQTT